MSAAFTTADELHAPFGRRGYAAARVLDGGTPAWVEAGLPVKGGLTNLLDQADDVVLKPYGRGRTAMEAYLRWEEALDTKDRSPDDLLPEAKPRS